ncbi:nucleotide sugar dehydrogenase [Gemmatimonadota bacterium]
MDNCVTLHGKQLLERIQERTARVGVIGLGYVGLPLIWTFHERGFQVLGFDIDESKIKHFKDGTSYIKHIGSEIMPKLAASDRCQATSDFSRVPEVDVLLLCVPTPLGEHRDPDMSFVVETVRMIGPHLRAGQLIVLESTTYPGTTEELVKPLCIELSSVEAGAGLFFAYSPEREDPGNRDYSTSTIPKVVGADSEEALRIADALYSSVITQTVSVSNTRTAEAVKLVENIFRSVNIALVNELKTVFYEMDIDIYEVIEAAKTKPFGFMPFYPGPGLGGHCIPIDPFYLTWKSREFGLNTRFIELAGEINNSMPAWVVSRCVEALNGQGKAMKGSRILCIGLAYKPNIDDVRESPTFAVMDLLKDLEAEVCYFDPHVPIIPTTRKHMDWAGLESIEWSQKEITVFDLAIVLTAHDGVDYEQLASWAPCIVDTRNIVKEDGNILRA